MPRELSKVHAKIQKIVLSDYSTWDERPEIHPTVVSLGDVFVHFDMEEEEVPWTVAILIDEVTGLDSDDEPYHFEQGYFATVTQAANAAVDAALWLKLTPRKDVVHAAERDKFAFLGLLDNPEKKQD